ncbi:MAG TPA: ParB/RepB/Spo0J family partition protein [Candidatus Solibacter sp.]|nr:ParB/RepB/Spo0J family partition protein [Candidatus Solibacter sp.]
MNKPDNTRKALGKGLGALLPTRPAPVAPPPPPPPPAPQAERSAEVQIDLIDPNPLQPRRQFEKARLDELAQSIRANGIIQPLVVRKAGDRYQLIAGERRWRAAKLAEAQTVPIVVRDIPEERLLEVTLIENIQREDLNPVETAQAFASMLSQLNLTPEEVGHRTGKDRSTIINFVRLLQLPKDILDLLAERKLSAGHGRALLSLPTADLQREVAERATAQGWNVRQTERMTQKMTEGRQAKKLEEVQIDPNVKAAIQAMEEKLGTKVKIHEGARGKGRIEIEYYSAEDLDRIYDVIVGTT